MDLKLINDSGKSAATMPVPTQCSRASTTKR